MMISRETLKKLGDSLLQCDFAQHKSLIKPLGTEFRVEITDKLFKEFHLLACNIMTFF
jgi:hypothetical protein